MDDSSFSRESIGDQDDNVEGIIDFRVATVKFLQSLTVLLARLDPTYSNSHAPRLPPPSSTPLRSGGLPLWATAISPEPGPRGKNATEAGRAHAKAEAEIALFFGFVFPLSLPAE